MRLVGYLKRSQQPVTPATQLLKAVTTQNVIKYIRPVFPAAQSRDDVSRSACVGLQVLNLDIGHSLTRLLYPRARSPDTHWKRGWVRSTTGLDSMQKFSCQESNLESSALHPAARRT